MYRDGNRSRRAVAPAAAPHSVRTEHGRTVVTVNGTVDLAAGATLYKVLLDALDAGDDFVGVELGDVEFCDPAGVHALLDASAAARRRGRYLAVESASPEFEYAAGQLAVGKLLTRPPSPQPKPRRRSGRVVVGAMFAMLAMLFGV